MILSVCITTYNLERYIDQTLESVIKQNFDHEYEILIGDDGSDDNTVNKIKDWQEQYPKRISLFIMPRDKNMTYNPVYRASANRINLLRHARGKYITFLDGDDYYTDCNKLERQVAILENPQNYDCAMCAHNMNFYSEESGREVPIVPETVHEQKMTPEFYWGKQKIWIHAEAFIFRRCFLTEYNLRKFNLHYFDDNLIVFFFLKFGKIYYIPEKMANYRQNPTEWKLSSNLEQHILNAMDLCIEKKYNFKMFVSSARRHYPDYQKLFNNKTLFSDKLYRQYVEQAEEQKLYETLYFLQYNKAGLKGKCKVFLFFCLISLINRSNKNERND